jgi:hypothetical protein
MLLLSLGFFLTGVPERWSTLAPHWFSSDDMSSAVVREGLDRLGVGHGVYAGYIVGLLVVRAGVFYLVGALLFWRRSTDRVALLVAYVLVTLPSGDTDPAVLHAMARDEPVRAAIGILVELVAFTLVLWICLLFPDGHVRPGWTRIVAAVWLVAGIGALVLPGSPLDIMAWSAVLAVGFIPAAVLIALYAQGWRYRRISGPVERQQTKWFALGFAAVLGEFAGSQLLLAAVSPTWPAAAPDRAVLLDLLLYTVHILAFLAVPLSLAVAVLRHRLWDLGSLINRALVYGSLSATLAAIYLGAVVLLQSLLRVVTGQGSSLAVAASTLAIAALFQPLRRRLQVAIDRRFSRRRYDAGRALAAFSATLRDETDLGRIGSDLLGAVDEAMQPAHASLWLRAPHGDRTFP